MPGKALSLCVSLLFAVQYISFPAGVYARQADVRGQAQTGPAPAAAEPRGSAAAVVPDPAAPNAEVAAVLASAVQVAAGWYHTCALIAAGGVKCWGANHRGQLGDGTTTDRSTSVDVSGLTSGVATVTTGMAHTCALTAAGGVKCWGNNYSGQLGDGTTTDRYTPVDVVGLTSGVAAVAAGGSHTCAVMDAAHGGGVKCWGNNVFGQLGDGTTTYRYTPVYVSGLTGGVAAVAAGGYYTCVVMDATHGGGVKCWGTNGAGQLGDGTTTDRYTPVDVVGLTSGVAAVAAGGGGNWQHSCAVMDAAHGGGVKCWGSNSKGQLGDGTAMDRSTPVDVSGLTSGVAAVAASESHTCALMDATHGGGVKCWGDAGLLGDGTTTVRTTPVDVSGLTGGGVAVATGGNHTCAVMDAAHGGGVKCWGSNFSGELGDGTTTVRTTPVDVSGLTSGVTDVAAANDHTCVVMDAGHGGGVKCWGNNGYGQLGDGTTIHRYTPVDVVGLTSDVAAVAAGQSYACAVMNVGHGGGVKCWGNNYSGQLGDGTTTDRYTPVDVVGLTGGVVAVAAGGYHTCALTSGGGVKCWGNNYSGQLGDGTTTDRYTPVDVVGLTSGVAAVAAGGGHTCAVMDAAYGGGVKCWGTNYHGQLGDGTTTDHPTPVDVNGLTSGVAAVVAGPYLYTCAVMDAAHGGGVKCWGYNVTGQLGDGTTTDRCTPVDVNGLGSGVAAVAASYVHTCAVMDAAHGGGVKCWGQNSEGQLGDGTRTGRYTPVNVSGLTSGGVAVTAGQMHTCALMDAVHSGGIKCWGMNRVGELGFNSGLTPVDVVGFGGGSTGSVSGRVRGAAGAPLVGVTISAGAAGSATTDSSGAYTVSGLAAGTYTLTPSKSGYSFAPTRRTVNLSGNVNGQDFRGVAATTFLDLPFSYDGTEASFVTALYDTDHSGRVDSWFDHDLPNYSKNQRLRLYDGRERTKDPYNLTLGCYERRCYDGHNGFDFSYTDPDTKLPGRQPLPIHPAAGGVVVGNGVVTACNEACRYGSCASCGSYGNYVVVNHQNGYFTRYAHLNQVYVVNPNQPVVTGDTLGTMGTTGHSDGPHLHFSVHLDSNGNGQWDGENVDKPLDPCGYMGESDPWVVNGGPISARLWRYACTPGQQASVSTNQGAHMTDATGSTTAAIPPSAISGQATLELSPGPVAGALAQLRSIGRSFWLRLLEWLPESSGQARTAALLESTAAFTLAQPITLTVAYSATNVLHLDVSQLALRLWDEGQEVWRPLPTVVDPIGRVVTATSQYLGDFDLQAPLLCAADTTEPDDAYHSANEIVPSSTPIRRLFDIPDDQDWFRLSLIGGTKYIMRTTNVGPGVDTVLQIYDIDSLTVLAQDDNSGGGKASRIEWQAPYDGTYFARVSPANGSASGCGATYDLSVEAMKKVYLPLVIRN